MTFPHASVLLAEILQFFDQRPLRVFVDATLGAGGHSDAILNAHPEIETLLGIDQDPVALNIAKERLSKNKGRILLKLSNFRDFSKLLDESGIPEADGILLDLGVSSMQLDMPEKGFSFMREGPLDMRMDPSGDLTAEEIINTWSESQLGRIFREYGEEKQWRSAARAIVTARKHEPIKTTLQLADVLKPALGWKSKKGINPLTLIFQALRISVNDELGAIEKALPEAISRLRKGGRLAVISFHSLEDRIAKNILRFAASDKYDTSGIAGLFLDKEPVVKMITKKPIIAGEDEVKKNARSRSAKLRVVEKL